MPRPSKKKPVVKPKATVKPHTSVYFEPQLQRELRLECLHQKTTLTALLAEAWRHFKVCQGGVVTRI
jgi:hypothetical protein